MFVQVGADLAKILIDSLRLKRHRACTVCAELLPLLLGEKHVNIGAIK